VRARHYASQQGQWTSVDPLWPEERAYGYAAGSPTGATDPSGLGCTEFVKSFFIAGKSRTERFTNCQGWLEEYDRLRVRHKLPPICPEGPIEICKACVAATGLKYDCSFYPAIPPCPTEPKENDWGRFAAVGSIIPFAGEGAAKFPWDSCYRTCYLTASFPVSAPNKKSYAKRALQHAMP
jgi:hypothetical protein